MQEPHFLIVIPSYNNELFCEKNLLSVLSQTYPFFRVIFIDDASTDETLKKVKALSNGFLEIWENKRNVGALENIYRAIHKAKDHEIIVTVDGDDWLSHDRVLEELAKVYKGSNVWLTYGQYQHFPSGVLGHSAPYKAPLRETPWVTSHLRTFYAGLFKKIEKKDLLHEGEFFRVAWDLAFMFPMIEMAGEKRVQFISKILYVYNSINPLRDGAIRHQFQQEMGKLIRSKEPYPLLLEKIFA